MSEDVTIVREQPSADIVEKAPVAVGVTLAPAQIEVTQEKVVEVVLSYQGRPGPPGSSGQDGIGLTHRYLQQTVEATEWIFNHNLGRQPLVQVFNTGLHEVIADVVHMNDNQCRIYFVVPMTGSARAI